MSETVNLASAMAITILMVFLFRFIRKQIIPDLRRRRLTQTLGGLAIIIGSILLSIWLKKNG